MAKSNRIATTMALLSLTAASSVAIATPSAHAVDTKTLVISSDLPLGSANFASSDSINKAIELYLKQINYSAGKYKVAFKIYNDSATPTGGWGPIQCAKNAIAHVANAAEVAVMGTFNSGCAKLELPILNQSTPGAMLMVSNANTNPGLTKAWGQGEPAVYYPTGVRNYARVCTTDDQQGAADAEFLKFKGVTSVYVLNDGQSYGNGVAQAFIAKAKSIGLKVLSPGISGESWDPTVSDYTPLFEKIKLLSPDAIFAGGSYSNNGGALIKAKVAVLGDNTQVKFMAPDGFSGFPAFSSALEAQGAYLSFAGLTNDYITQSQPNGITANFLASYKQAYGKDVVGSYALYGVAAVQVILAAIAKSDGTRKGVSKAVFSGSGITIPATSSVLGRAIHISTGKGSEKVTAGDTTATDITIEQVANNQESTLQVWVTK